MRTAAGPNAAREKHMAMRWSSQVPMCASRQPPRTGGVTRSQSGPDSTVAPSFSSSVCMAWIRSVSFTRQLPMLRSRHGPSAYRASAAAVMAASGIRLKSVSKALSRSPSATFTPLTSIQSDRS